MSACQKRKKATTNAVAFWMDEGNLESDRRNSHGADRRCHHDKRCRINTVQRINDACPAGKNFAQAQ